MPSGEVRPRGEGGRDTALKAELHPSRAAIDISPRGWLPGSIAGGSPSLLSPGLDGAALHDSHVRLSLCLAAGDGG